jgi:CheY-like chemotaxis protein
LATILIVDDEPPIRALLAELLGEDGYQVRVAMHGAQALALVAQARPDLVLSDVMMPVLNGRDLCRALKAGAGTKDIPVILMTSAGQHEADGAGADAYIGKPFNLKDLEALVRSWLP